MLLRYDSQRRRRQTTIQELIIEIRIVGIVVLVNVVFIGFVALLLVAAAALVVGRRRRPLVVGATAPHNGLADASNPVVLFGFRVGVEQVAGFGRADFKRVAFLGFEVGRFDRGAVRQIHHAVRAARLVFAKEELVAFENKVAAAPFLCVCERV